MRPPAPGSASARRECSPKRAHAGPLADGAALGNGPLTRRFQLESTRHLIRLKGSTPTMMAAMAERSRRARSASAAAAHDGAPVEQAGEGVDVGRAAQLLAGAAPTSQCWPVGAFPLRLGAVGGPAAGEARGGQAVAQHGAHDSVVVGDQHLHPGACP